VSRRGTRNSALTFNQTVIHKAAMSSVTSIHDANVITGRHRNRN